MLKSFCRSSKHFGKASQCWLWKHIEAFLKHLASLGYAEETLVTKAYVLLKFGLFIQEQGVYQISELAAWNEIFVRPYKNKHTKTLTVSMIHHFICYLQETGTIPKPIPKELPIPFNDELCEYINFIQSCRGLQQITIAHIKSYCCKFLRYVYGSGIRQLRLLKQDVICNFIIAEGKRYTRARMGAHCLKLRKFLSYLYSARITKVDFSAVVVTPKTYTHERCPCFLTKTEVNMVLSAVDRSTKLGKRNYAIMLLLATYGLRGIEVSQLKLSDVDWNSDKIHIRNRKAGNSSVYPLMPLVGNAILEYLKVRPHNCNQQIFITYPAPHKPICTCSLSTMVKRCLRRIGLDRKGVGLYVFRYSCAQRLFEVDSPLKLIADYLGHRSLRTTRRYIKIDINHLREVALEIEEAIP
jgi:site-specific recombinase XerD